MIANRTPFSLQDFCKCSIVDDVDGQRTHDGQLRFRCVVGHLGRGVGVATNRAAEQEASDQECQEVFLKSR
jgi:hypothetical protein